MINFPTLTPGKIFVSEQGDRFQATISGWRNTDTGQIFVPDSKGTMPTVAAVTRIGPSIAIQNLSTVVTDAQVTTAVAALQIQLDRDWQPAWATTATLTAYKKTQVIPATSWIIYIMDNSDYAGALGYHDENARYKPYGKVFAKTAKDYGYSWTVTLSHELLEMMADPYINLTVFNQDTNTTGLLYAYEVCDACEADAFGYRINNVLVSDFVYPAWFDYYQLARGTRFNYRNTITAPFQLLGGGYIGVFDVSSGSGWTTINARGEKGPADETNFRDRRFRIK
jgi:hypothetical protein